MKIVKPFLILTLLLSFGACVQRTSTSSGTASNPSSSGTGTGTGTGTTTPSVSTVSPYSIPIVLHSNTHKVTGYRPSYSTYGDPKQAGTNQKKFLTDSYLNVRLKGNTPPTSGTSDNYGVACSTDRWMYSTLKVTVEVKARESTTVLDQYTFDVPVGSYSEAHAFNVPTTTNPVEIRLVNMEWDYWCTACQGGLNCLNPDSYCPTAMIWKNEYQTVFPCISLEMQVATDYTKDF